MIIVFFVVVIFFFFDWQAAGRRWSCSRACAGFDDNLAGGGASLELLEGQILPGVAALDSA